MIGKVLLLAVASLCAFSVTAADTYPTRPIRMVLSNGPGSAGDILGRIAFMRAAESLGQQIVVDNRTGAGGTIAVEIVARAAPDGYTLLATSFATHSVAPHTYKSVPYHPINDFAPISIVSSSPSMMTVHPSVPVHNVKDLLALARSRPGQINYASAGAGTNPHIAGELFNILGKVSLVPVHFKGGGPSLIAAMSGEVSATFTNIAETSAFVRANRLRALAVTSPKRSPAFPQVPTVDESGLPGYEFVTWFAFLAPAKTPRAIIVQLNEQLRKTLATPEQIKLFAERGLDIVASTPEAASDHLKKEVERWARVIKERGMRAE